MAGQGDLPMKCPKCDGEMVVAFTRHDGCRRFVCERCGCEVGEETDEWFREQGKVTC